MIMTGTYKEAERTIKEILENTVGIKWIRTDQPQRTNNKEIKEARKIKKEMWNKFQTACKTGSEGKKQKQKKNTWRARKNRET